MIYTVYCLVLIIYSVTTVQDVRLELAQEDAAQAARGILPPHSIGPTEFLTSGLDLEEQQ